MESGGTIKRPPLAGIRIVDLTRLVAGPFAGILLADLGAELIKVETGGGDITRGRTPIVDGVSMYYAALNRNKKSVSLNLYNERAKELFRELVKVSDVVMENFRPGTMAAMGFDYESLKAIKPDIILASGSGFGQNGPMAKRSAQNRVLEAFTGLQSLTGYPDRPPVRSGVAVVDYSTGLYLTIGILAAIMYHQQTGEGQHVDCCLMDSAISLLAGVFVPYLAGGELPQREGNSTGNSSLTNMFETKDGYVHIAAAHNNQFWKVAKVIGREDLVGDPRFKTSPDRIAHKDELETIVQDWLCQRTTKEAFSALLAEGVTCGTLNTIADMVKEPQVHAREMIQEVEHPRIGKIPVPGTAIKFSSIPKVPLKHPPDMGENNEDILCGLLGHSKEELGAWEMEGVFEEKGGGANDAG